MSFEAQMTAIYRLFYKEPAREAFLGGGVPPVDGLTDSELAELRAVPAARLRRVVELHRGDIGRGWYQPRVPATWMALQGVLEVSEDELVGMLTGSDAFETRVNDDADGRALAGFVEELAEAGRLVDGDWLVDLLAYEQLVRGAWDGVARCEAMTDSGGSAPRFALRRFEWDVRGIVAAVLESGLVPSGEERMEHWMLFGRDEEGVSELEVDEDSAPVMAALLHGERVGDEGKGAVEALRAMGWRG